MVLQIAADDHGKSHLRRVEGLSRLTSPSEPSCGLLFPASRIPVICQVLLSIEVD